MSYLHYIRPLPYFKREGISEGYSTTALHLRWLARRERTLWSWWSLVCPQWADVAAAGRKQLGYERKVKRSGVEPVILVFPNRGQNTQSTHLQNAWTPCAKESMEGYQVSCKMKIRIRGNANLSYQVRIRQRKLGVKIVICLCFIVENDFVLWLFTQQMGEINHGKANVNNIEREWEKKAGSDNRLLMWLRTNTKLWPSLTQGLLGL